MRGCAGQKRHHTLALCGADCERGRCAVAVGPPCGFARQTSRGCVGRSYSLGFGGRGSSSEMRFEARARYSRPPRAACPGRRRCRFSRCCYYCCCCSCCGCSCCQPWLRQRLQWRPRRHWWCWRQAAVVGECCEQTTQHRAGERRSTTRGFLPCFAGQGFCGMLCLSRVSGCQEGPFLMQSQLPPRQQMGRTTKNSVCVR
mmetsp:Transcript_104303/g.276396  ORF Transcript_104303/g.276396 Transcript_104303/m.276396 type:complete len:200 (-) Transcript_104303:22-621(-)